MWLSAIASALHLLCLALGLTTLALRERALAAPLDAAGVKRVFAVDNASGLIALVWMATGFWRAFGPLEKGGAFYLHSPLFWVKMALVLVGWGFEAPTMMTLIRWRQAVALGNAPDVSRVARLRRLHWFEGACILAAVLAASLMARGVGSAPTHALSPEAARGEAVYRVHCVGCHQADGRGLNGRLAADFVGDPRRLARDDATLLGIIAHGAPGTAMTGFDTRLTEADRRAVLTYVKGFRR